MEKITITNYGIANVLYTMAKLKFQKRKPTICLSCGEKGHKGYFVRLGTGGKSGEPMLRVNVGNFYIPYKGNVGNWYSSFPMYQRNGKTRVNTYVPIKQGLVQVQR